MIEELRHEGKPGGRPPLGDGLIRATEALRDRRDASAPNGRLEVIEGAGHFTNVERRNRFNQLLREFLQTTECIASGPP
jgi:pimeloyl-ACP methyl ester carboxylesterase